MYTILHLLVFIITYALFKIHNMLMKDRKHIKTSRKRSKDIIITWKILTVETKYKRIHLHKTRF